MMHSFVFDVIFCHLLQLFGILGSAPTNDLKHAAACCSMPQHAAIQQIFLRDRWCLPEYYEVLPEVACLLAVCFLSFQEELKSTTRGYEGQLRRQLEANIRTQRQIVEQVAQVHSAGLTPNMMLKYMTDSQAQTFGPVTQHNINKWLGQPYKEVPPNAWMDFASHLLTCLEKEAVANAQKVPCMFSLYRCGPP